MDARKLGRWLGRLAAVAIFGAGATLGMSAVASADAGADESQDMDAVVEMSEATQPKANSWD